MKTDSMQQELFKEFEAAQKGKKKTQGSILPRNYVLLSVSYEQVIFIAIGIIMLMVLVFSLGVERGKYLALIPAKAKAETAAKKALKPQAAPEKPETEAASGEKEGPEAETATKPVIETKKDVKAAQPEGLFTIQLIAYRSKKSAQKELLMLNKKGYNPFIVTGGGYYQICVGEYKTQQDAQKILRELAKKGYSDGFIRKR